jgi:hypothetical protein
MLGGIQTRTVATGVEFAMSSPDGAHVGDSNDWMGRGPMAFRLACGIASSFTVCDFLRHYMCRCRDSRPHGARAYQP